MEELQTLIRSYFNIDTGTSATILITLTVFILGFLIQWIARQIEKYLNRKNQRRNFNRTTEVLSKQIRKQAEGYFRSTETVRIDKKEEFYFAAVTLYPVRLFEDIGYQECYTAFFTGPENLYGAFKSRKIKPFNKIWETIYAVDKWHEKTLVQFEGFVVKYNELNDLRNLPVNSHRKFIDGLIPEKARIQSDPSLKNYFNEVGKIHVNWQNQLERRRPDIVHRKLVLPLRILNRKYPDLAMARKMNDNLIPASSAYENQWRHLKVYRKQLFLYFVMFKGNSILLRKCLSSINRF
ncbi:MAG: hypothetical protein ACI85F_002188 [Bacteroidia bacterium]|jgi:hypothetical protein